jgi:small neutral amino acid transporter SnatA (MarC family)
LRSFAAKISCTVEGDRERFSLSGEAESVYRQIVIPFAMPLLVGPGVIATL